MVYSGTGNLLETRKFICVNFDGSNNNKVWNIQLYDNDDVYVEWGKCGHIRPFDNKTHQGKGRKFFDSKIREKTREGNKNDGKYTENLTSGTSITSSVPKTDLLSISKQQIKTNDPIVERLVEELVRENAHNILVATGGSITYSDGLFRTPQGIIVPEQINEARVFLNDIAEQVDKKKFKFMESMVQYLRLIPHDLGYSKPTPESLFPNLDSVKKESDLLDGLETSFNKPQKVEEKTDVKVEVPKVFDVKMFLENDKLDEITRLFKSTLQYSHTSSKLGVKNIYAVSIKTMADTFDQKIGNIMRLWHGTKTANLLSILKSGLIIPKSSGSIAITGRMYGDGVYFSSISTKSLNYAQGYWSGQNHNRCFMFLADVAMGNPYHPRGSNQRLQLSNEYHSTWAKPGISGVSNDEMIVYKLTQCNLVYLIEFADK